MEQDLERWRTMGANMTFHYPQKPVLRVRTRSVPKAKAKTQTHIENIKPAVKGPTLRHILDRATNQQKKVIKEVVKLSPTKLNHAYQKVADMNEPRFGRRSNSRGATKTINSIDSGMVQESNVEHIEHVQSIQPSDEKDIFDAVQTGEVDMFTLLEQFDSIKLGVNVPITEHGQNHEESAVKQSDKKHRKAGEANSVGFHPYVPLPNVNLALTHTQKHQALKNVDELVRGGKHDNMIKSLEQELEYELSKLPATNQINIERLRIVSTIFEKTISCFHHFGPLLAQIKSEYDKMISEYTTSSFEVSYLLSRIQKLSSNNQNRMLVKMERARVKELESQGESLKNENEKLKEEMVYKLSVYGAYLPESVLNDPAVVHSDGGNLSSNTTSTSITGKRLFEYGQDPISIRDNQIKAQKDLIDTQVHKTHKVKEIQDLRTKMEKEFVPRVTKEKLEDVVKNLQAKSSHYSNLSQNLESQVSELRSQIKNLENDVRNREKEYTFLLQEYKDVNEQRLQEQQQQQASIAASSGPQKRPSTVSLEASPATANVQDSKAPIEKANESTKDSIESTPT